MKIDENKPPKALAKRLWHILRVLYYTLHKTISKHKLMLDLNLHLLLQRSKIAGKAIGNLLASHHHHHHDKSYCLPREVEFSCSNTPFHVTKRKSRNHCRHDPVSDIAKAFEMLDYEESAGDIFSDEGDGLRVRQLRVTDSPFPIRDEEEGEGGSQVDREAEEFIKRFYEQLRLQK